MNLNKIAIVRKENGKYKLYSKNKNPKTGKRKLLGEANTLKEIKKRERQINYFKHQSDDQNSYDEGTKALITISNIAQYLESAGLIKEADELYQTMNVIDNNLISTDTAFSSGLLNIPEAMKAANVLHNLASALDNISLFKDADIIDDMLYKIANNTDKDVLKKVILIKRDFKDGKFNNLTADEAMAMIAKKLNMNVLNNQEGGFIAGLATVMQFIEPRDAFGDPNYFRDAIYIFENYNTIRDIDEMDNIDMLAKLNGLQGITSIDGASSGHFSGFSDAYFFQTYQNLDNRYKIAP